ncbi:hypothetical protein ABIA39_008562 [Nocardia sp. GAS34]|uniref:hypothetical protein n=1 Tax=unclassified Nocardia TaxID=2637762 RepID=UPI003D218F3D
MSIASHLNCLETSAAASVESSCLVSFFGKSNLEYRTRLANIEDGESVYCRSGSLKDIELRGCHIAALNEWSNAVVVFIVGFLPEVRGRLRDRPLTAIANVVFDHCSTVVAAMRHRHPEQSHMRLLAQTDRSNGGMSRLFRRGGTYTGITTDGWPLYEPLRETTYSHLILPTDGLRDG